MQRGLVGLGVELPNRFKTWKLFHGSETEMPGVPRLEINLHLSGHASHPDAAVGASGGFPSKSLASLAVRPILGLADP
jgi:hypothetical protein